MIQVTIRHVELDKNGAKKFAEIPPSEIKPLIDLLESGLSIYDFSDDATNGTGFEDCRYYSHQIVRYDSEGYVFEIIVDGPNP